MDWSILLNYGWLTLLGLFVHFLDKLDSARAKPEFTWGEFRRKNMIGYITATIMCFVGLLLMGDGIELVPGATKVVITFGIGFGGGSMVRSAVSKYMQN